MQRERVAKYRAAIKGKAAEYNITYKKDYINRPENKEKYNELNKTCVEKYRNQLKQVMTALTLRTANKNVKKLKKNASEAKKQLKKGEPLCSD
jgi:hypothetical protein